MAAAPVIAADVFADVFGNSRGRPDMDAAVRSDQMPQVREEAERLLLCSNTPSIAAELADLIERYPELATEHLPEGAESSVAERLAIRYIDCHLSIHGERLARLAYAFGVSDLAVNPGALKREFRAIAVLEQRHLVADVIAAAGPDLADRTADRTGWLMGEAYAHLMADEVMDGGPTGNTRHLLRLDEHEPFNDGDLVRELARLAHLVGFDHDTEFVDKLAEHIGPHLRALMDGSLDNPEFEALERIPREGQPDPATQS